MGKDPIYLSAESADSKGEWTAAIAKSSAIDASEQSLILAGLNLECGGQGAAKHQNDKARRRKSKIVVSPDIRQQLIWDLMATKHVLENHRERRWKQGYNPLADISNRYDRAQNAAQQEGLRRAVLIKQRKISAALKKHISGGSSLSEGHPVVKRNIDQQLQELEGKLQLLDEDLRVTKQETWKKLITLKSQKECEIETLHALGVVNDKKHQPRRGSWPSLSQLSTAAADSTVTTPDAGVKRGGGEGDKSPAHSRVHSSADSHYSCVEIETHEKLNEEAEQEIVKFQKFAKKFFERRGQQALYFKFFPE